MQNHIQHETMQQLETLYKEWEIDIQDLKAQSNLHCVPHCGQCCTRLEPYISILEATYVLYKISPISEKLQQSFQCSQEYKKMICPFYDETIPFRCTIYSHRPVICRLYSFACDKTKQYILCPNIQKTYPNETYKAQQLLLQKKCHLPSYQEAFQQLCKIDYQLATDYHPFNRSLELAYQIYFSEIPYQPSLPSFFCQYIRNKHQK